VLKPWKKAKMSGKLSSGLRGRTASTRECPKSPGEPLKIPCSGEREQRSKGNRTGASEEICEEWEASSPQNGQRGEKRGEKSSPSGEGVIKNTLESRRALRKKRKRGNKVL